jgi:hypothetical protein
MRYKGLFAVLTLQLMTAIGTYAQDLNVLDRDLWVTQGADGGFHLFIRKKPDIASVLLTETTKDPSFQEDNYAYRASEWNPINGDEYRVLDGAVIPQEDKIWSLIDSTSEYVEELKMEVFHIYIPYLLSYGYQWGRHGEVYVGDGTYLNVRAFELPYGDYRGRFNDNPFILRINQVELAGLPEDLYMKDASDAYLDITKATGGEVYRSRGPEDLVDTIGAILAKAHGIDLDLVFCIDTTASMENDIEALKEELVEVLSKIPDNFKGFRVGIVLFRDYFDEYLTRIIPFSSDMKLIQKNINSIRAHGGRDIPEAIHEALYDAANKFPWEAAERQILLIGDAPPHPRPRGKITKEMAEKAAADKGITVNAILLPQ